jgi:hypothetical protein
MLNRVASLAETSADRATCHSVEAFTAGLVDRFLEKNFKTLQLSMSCLEKHTTFLNSNQATN